MLNIFLRQGELNETMGREYANWDVVKRSLMRSYKFAIAFENSNSPDYVTEKLFQPLAEGTVPSMCIHCRCKIWCKLRCVRVCVRERVRVRVRVRVHVRVCVRVRVRLRVRVCALHFGRC